MPHIKKSSDSQTGLKVTAVSDLKLIKNILAGKDMDDSYVEMSRRYENVFYKICHGYSIALRNAGLSIDEVLAEKDYVLLNCIKTFDPSKKSKFSTWVGNHARFLCLNSINSRKLITSYDSDNIKNFIEDKQAPSVDFIDMKANIDFIDNILSQFSDERVSKIIKLRYFSDLNKPTWKKIGKKMNISSQTAINLHNKGLVFLRKKMSSPNVSDRV